MKGQYISLALHEISLTTKNHLNRFKLLIVNFQNWRID